MKSYNISSESLQDAAKRICTGYNPKLHTIKGWSINRAIELANWQAEKDKAIIDKLRNALQESLDQLESWNQESEPTFTMRRMSELLNQLNETK